MCELVLEIERFLYVTWNKVPIHITEPSYTRFLHSRLPPTYHTSPSVSYQAKSSSIVTSHNHSPHHPLLSLLSRRHVSYGKAVLQNRSQDSDSVNHLEIQPMYQVRMSLRCSLPLRSRRFALHLLRGKERNPRFWKK